MNRLSDTNRPGRDPFRELYEREESRKKGPSFFGGIARFMVLVMIGCAAGGAGVALQGYFHFTQNLPSIDKLKNYSPAIVSNLYDAKGLFIAEFAHQRRFVVPIDEIPHLLQKAFIAAEDKNFKLHDGVDKEAIARAIKENLKGRRVGGSTITQQVAKNFLLTNEVKFTRKIKEAILSLRIEQSLTKQEILHLYLNEIYLGSGAYGVEAAARTYFGKHVQDLTIAECAMIAGLAKAPGSNSPRKNLQKAVDRRSYVLKRMLEDNHISQEQYETAMNEEPRLAPKQPLGPTVAQDFIEHVRRYVAEKYGNEALYKEGLQVYTTIDVDLTKAAVEAVDSGLRELDKREGYRGPIKTLSVQGVMDFLEEKTKSMDEPLRFGQVAEGVVTQIDQENIYVRMGSYVKGDTKKEYVGVIKIDPNPKWWCRKPYLRPEKRTRNYGYGDLPFQVGDLITVRLVDPNVKRRELYLKKYGKTDPEMKNFNAKEYTEDKVTYFPLEPEQEPLVQAALMMRENRSGYVRVMVGGHSGSSSEYNRAIQARRQAGSSYKPIIYAAALNKGFTCADVLEDTPLVMTVPGTGEVWRPKNYGGGHAGRVTFRDCLVHSRNIPTVKILQQIGIEHAKSYARKLGYTSPMVNNLTAALGSTGVSLEEQLNAYSVFPNMGYAVPGVYVTKIVDRNGKVLEQHRPPVLLDDPVQPDTPEIQTVSHSRPNYTPRERDGETLDRGAGTARRVIDEGTAYIMTTMLQGVIQEGTATVLKKIVGRPDIAGKTGTTNESVDAWFMGFSPDYTCGVWVGFEDNVSMGEGETGGKAAAPIWGAFMKTVLKDKPVKEYTPPPSVEFRRIDTRTGLVSPAGGFVEVFKRGSSPITPEPRAIKGSRWDNYGADLDQF